MTNTVTSSRLEAKKIYLKDVSFESPNAPLIFTKIQTQPPIVDIHIELFHSRLEVKEDFYEVSLKITVTARPKNEKWIAFLAEIEQAGIFLLQHKENEKVEIMKQVTCPYILLPFAREEINNLVSKGGFQQLLLAPINFEALYFHKQNSKESTEISTSD